MEIPRGVPLRYNGLVQKGFRIESLRIKLAAFQHQARFRKTHVAVLRRIRRQSGGGHLVRIPSARGAANSQRLVVLMAEEGKRELLPGLNEAEGMALGTDNHECHGLLPHEAQAAPAGRHHIEMLRRSSRHQHPVVPMIIEVRAKNCYAFEDDITFSMKADMRNKKFGANVHKENNFNVLKTVGIYGPNNAGKTCLIKCIRAIRNVLLNKKNGLMPNIFTDSDVCELGVTFMASGRKFSYDFKYDAEKEEYIYESFSEIFKDQYNNEKEVCWLKKDTVSEVYECIDEAVQTMIPVVSKNNLLCYVIDTSKFEHINEMKQILVGFAEKIDIINMNNIPMQHTIELMKNKNQLQQKVVEFIKNADLYMDNFEYVDMDKIQLKTGEGDEKPDEKVLDIPENIMDQIRLVSTYKGVHVPSMMFDSTGTKKIAAIASYVIEALEQGRILVVDELDSSIHFKLTRAIVAMFNNELNTSAQMIFTVHDINLMDCKRMFRKEQIWFVHKDEEGVYVYSLADFTAQQGVRDTTDVMEKYRKGALGALPDPELINSLLSIKSDVKGDDADA